MSTLNELKKDIKSQIDAVKNINDTPQNYIDSQKDKLVSGLPSFSPFGAKTLDSFIPKRTTKKETHNDVFSRLDKITKINFQKILHIFLLYINVCYIRQF